VTPAVTLKHKRLALLSTQLLTAENDRKNLQAAYEAASKASDPYTIRKFRLPSESRNCGKKISTLKEREDALLVAYTKEWPEVKRIEAQL